MDISYVIIIYIIIITITINLIIPTIILFI